MGSSPKSKSPRPLIRQHSRKPSVSPRFNGGPALSPIGPLRRQSPVMDSLSSPFPSFNGGPAQLPVSVDNPLPRRIHPRSITQAAQAPDIPNLVLHNDWLNQQSSYRRNGQRQRLLYLQRNELPPRLSPSRRSAQSVSIFEPFRNHMHTESGNTILELDDGTGIDMGNVDIETAFSMLRRVEYTELGAATYSIAGFPNIEMGILPDGSIVSLHNPPQPQPPQPESIRQVGLFARLKRLGKNKIAPAHTTGMGGRTRARKMGRKGRKGTNKRRRYIVAKTRRQRPRRRGNKPPRTLRN